MPALLLCTGWGASINTPKSSELGMGASKGPFPPHAGVPVLPRAGERTQVPPWLPAPPRPPAPFLLPRLPQGSGSQKRLPGSRKELVPLACQHWRFSRSLLQGGRAALAPSHPKG